jgi:hypothetical protein
VLDAHPDVVLCRTLSMVVDRSRVGTRADGEAKCLAPDDPGQLATDAPPAPTRFGARCAPGPARGLGLIRMSALSNIRRSRRSGTGTPPAADEAAALHRQLGEQGAVGADEGLKKRTPLRAA